MLVTGYWAQLIYLPYNHVTLFIAFCIVTDFFGDGSEKIFLMAWFLKDLCVCIGAVFHTSPIFTNMKWFLLSLLVEGLLQNCFNLNYGFQVTSIFWLLSHLNTVVVSTHFCGHSRSRWLISWMKLPNFVSGRAQNPQSVGLTVS
jgi:hypothetical protein